MAKVREREGKNNWDLESNGYAVGDPDPPAFHIFG